MKILFNRDMLRHNQNGRVEGPRRIAKLAELPDVDDCVPSVDGEKLLALAHRTDYIERIKELCRKNQHIAEVNTSIHTYNSAVLAVGLSVDAAINGDFAAVRPPGHHASSDREGGFCFFNNMAIAAIHLSNQGKRVLVIDIDGHHGNGTQCIIEARAAHPDGAGEIMFASIDGEFGWPHILIRPGITRINGRTCSINLLVPAGAGDDMLMDSVNLVMQASKEFRPDVIGISFGTDGHRDDNLGLKYTEHGFYGLGRALHRSGKKTFAVLEGGYHSLVVECIDAFIAGIEGRNPPYEVPGTISQQRLWDRFNDITREVKGVLLDNNHGMHQEMETEDIIL